MQRDVVADLAAAVRSLHKRALWSVISATTLAVGIGSAVAMFAVVHAVLIHPLPVHDQDGLAFATKHPKGDRQGLPFSLAEYNALRGLASVSDVAGAQSDGPVPASVSVGERAFRINVTTITRNFFEVLGVRPALGQLTVGPNRPRAWWS